MITFGISTLKIFPRFVSESPWILSTVSWVLFYSTYRRLSRCSVWDRLHLPADSSSNSDHSQNTRTSTPRLCIRFQDLPLIKTITCLYNQVPVWLLPIEFCSTDCVLLLSITLLVTMNSSKDELLQFGRRLGHCDVSLPTHRQDDAPQVFRNYDHDFLQNAFVFFSMSTFQDATVCFIILILRPVSSRHLPKYSFAERLHLPLTF